MDATIPLEVHHGQNSMAVVARLPGVRLQDLHVAITRKLLTIDAETPEGSRHGSLALASPVDDGRAIMRFRDGILWMHLPKLPT